MTGSNPDFDKIREKDHHILVCIRDGINDVSSIKEETLYERREINWAFKKLERLGFLSVETPVGRVRYVKDGRTFDHEAPKHAVLTENGRKYFEQVNREDEVPEGLSEQEQVQRILDLEEQVTALEGHIESVVESIQNRFKRIEQRTDTLQEQIRSVRSLLAGGSNR